MSRTPIAAQEETRLALAAAAARAERQNQPKFLLYAAGALLAAAIIFVGVAFSGSLAASADLASQKKQAETTVQLAGRYRALKAAAQNGPTYQPATQIRTRIEQAGVDAGLKDRVPLPQTHTDPQRSIGSQQTRFDYEVRDENLPNLLAWMQKSLADVPGLEVYSLTLRPEAHKWKLNVSFSRWERIETQ